MLRRLFSSRGTKATIWLVALYYFFRLPWWALGLIAAAVLGAGFYLQVLDNEREAAYARALVEGPPAVVSIAQFDKDTDMNAAREVNVQAQPVLDYAYRLTIERASYDLHTFMVPLAAPGAQSDTEIVGIAYFRSPNEDFDNITPELLMAGLVGFGEFGPLINYNGKLGDMGRWDELTTEAFTDNGLAMPANMVVVHPYVDGREAALAPREPGEWTIFGVISKLAGAIGLLALLKLAFRSGSGGAPQEEVFEPAPSFEPETVAAPVAARTSGVPLWKQRSGLVDEAEDFAQPAFDEPQFDAEPALRFEAPESAAPIMENAPLIQPRRSFGVRKILIGLIGGAFVLLLSSVVVGLVQDSAASNQVASVTSMEEVAATTVADLVIPDADPNRHWTDIDVTPIIEWFVAKGVLALTGDMDALMTLGMIAGGVIILPFILMMFIRMRRTFVPKTSARFDAMGIN